MARTNDGHFFQNFMYLNLILSQFAVVFPFKLELGEHDGQPRIFCNHSFRNNINISFKIDYETINKTISKNKEVPIKTINNKNPFDYITDFAKDYFHLKSPHANFPMKYKIMKEPFSLNYYPLGIEELTNITVVYENNDTFVTDAIMFSLIDLSNNDTNDMENVVLYSSYKDIKDMKKYRLGTIENLKEKYKAINDIMLGENDEKRENEEKNNSIDDEVLLWDFNYSTSFKCRADNISKINVYYVKDFYADNMTDYLDIIVNCTSLFDENDYPVILINDLNPGGFFLVSSLMLEMLSPLVSANVYGAVRKTEKISNIDFDENKSNLSFKINN